MSIEESNSSFGYFGEAEAAIRRNEYATALRTLEEGFRTTYYSQQPIDTKSLLGCLFSVIGTLKLNLEQHFGAEWQFHELQPTPEMSCSFCGQPKNSVAKIITGPAVNICNQCVDICVGIIVDARTES